MLYIINTDSTDVKYHQIHHYNCAHRPSPQNKKELGNYSSDDIAMFIATDRYKDANQCLHCMASSNHD